MPCECGYQFVPGIDDELHAKFHAAYLYGPSLSVLDELTSTATIFGNSLFVIDAQIPEAQRKLFVAVADVAQATMTGYSYGYYGTVDEREQTMFVLASDGHAIGMAIVGLDGPCWKLSWAPGYSLQLMEKVASPGPHRIVARVWIAAAYHRRGFASQMLHAVARHYSIDCKDLGWELPLTPAGAQLLRSLLPGTWLGRADPITLRETLSDSVRDLQHRT